MFDKRIILMRKDVKFTHLKSNGTMTRGVTLHLKNPKEDKTKHRIRVDIFKTTGPLRWLCAVNAALKYESVMTTTDAEQPFATTRNGKGYTGKMFNKDLKRLLMGKHQASGRNRARFPVSGPRPETVIPVCKSGIGYVGKTRKVFLPVPPPIPLPLQLQLRSVS
jgi:hypothetical protein